MYTKGAVLLVCFQCVDTLLFASKHAEGMSLRYDAIFTLAYCGRHKSSHLPIKRGLGYLYLRFRISDY